MSLRILVAEPGTYATRALAILGKVGEVVWDPNPALDLVQACREQDVLIVRLAHRVTEEVMEQAPRLKIIATSTTGLDHIDLAAAERRGIKVVSLKGEREFLKTIRASSEHAMALLLALIRRIRTSSQAALEGVWAQDPFTGTELFEKTLGIIGFGRIGSIVSEMARGFGMRVQAYDPFVSAETVRSAGVDPVSLEELVATSDVVSLHATLDASTEGMFSADLIARLKPGAVFVNTARGQLVDEAALIDALRSGRLSGAAVDVLANEGDRDGLPKDPMVVYAQSHPHLLITPHIAGTTQESLEKTQVFLAEKVLRVLQGEAL